MALGGISIWQLVIILLIVVMLFGSKRLKNLGSDLAHAINGVKKTIGIEDDKPALNPRKVQTADAKAHEVQDSNSRY
ncbi:twin-arginine translocase TatA/TatE family subunit [Ectopseudomonas composti]|uniref:twin-arginine translocase TatA/TatE family subunit n=1 Tax=Ectopseudomonas composti TaxID=658457 RepID=UPI0007737E09|nr:twin-arginine translocase TatA/TatE family subunit [Pseudomonas composti]